MAAFKISIKATVSGCSAVPGPAQFEVLRPVVVADSGSYRMTR
jgi:hypothetical protein